MGMPLLISRTRCKIPIGSIEIFNKYGSIQYAHDVAQLNVNKAKELLEILPDSEAKTSLSLIADFVLSRKS